MGEKKAVFTVRNVMKVLALLCMIFVFCPSFLVSCSGVTVEIGAMSTVGGVKMYGEEIVKPQPIMLIYLLLPVAVMVFLFLKKFANRLNALIILICSGADLGLWMLFRAITKKEAEDNMCDFATTGWYKMTIIVLIALVVLAVLVLIRKLQMDADLAANISGGGTAGALNQMSKKVGQMSDAVTQLAGNVSASRVSKAEREQAIGFCQKCEPQLPME